ncbi:MAG: DUF1540 domain-containing protein [Deltaproteobacteria bacterium]|nr:DUF1540 domain-containing protein [Deltaproteobacteria bacterium]
MPISMPKILSCTVLECAYNINSECHTMAITVGDENHAACDTYYRKGNKGGAADLIGGVGACKVDLCKFNRSFECTASGINVAPHGGHADCKTFSPVSR